MKVKKNIDLTEFISSVKLCKSGVYFETAEGDSLALQSELCRYIFTTLEFRPEILYKGTIRFEDPEDLKFIHDFLED